MYKFIFYFIYKSQVNQKDGGAVVAKYLSSLIVSITIFIHIGLIYSLCRFLSFHFYNSDISFSSGRNHNSKFLFWMIVFIVNSDHVDPPFRAC
jgi:hypothetical protein